jgi:hypothetical protein
VSILPIGPIEAVDDLVCSATGSIDDDGQAVSYSYQWTSDTGSSVSSDTVPSSLTVSGEVWTCTVTPTDGVDSGVPTDESFIILEFIDPANCKDVLNNGQSTGDGVYSINPNGNGVISTYCDMTTDGGGWTLVLNRIVDSDNTGQNDLDLVNNSFNNNRDSNWNFNINLFWSDASEVVFAAKENDNCADCSISNYDSAIKVDRPSGSAWHPDCSGTSAAVSSTKLMGSNQGTVATAYMCEDTLGWGSCSNQVCHYGTHNTDTSGNGSWSSNASVEMHFPSKNSSYASYGSVNSTDGSAWCRSCAGGLPSTYNNSSTCCNNSTYNAKSRWTIWLR